MQLRHATKASSVTAEENTPSKYKAGGHALNHSMGLQGSRHSPEQLRLAKAIDTRKAVLQQW